MITETEMVNKKMDLNNRKMKYHPPSLFQVSKKSLIIKTSFNYSWKNKTPWWNIHKSHTRYFIKVIVLCVLMQIVILHFLNEHIFPSFRKIITKWGAPPQVPTMCDGGCEPAWPAPPQVPAMCDGGCEPAWSLVQVSYHRVVTSAATFFSSARASAVTSAAGILTPFKRCANR